jgi:uncharacterized protein (TIGR03437 family)
MVNGKTAVVAYVSPTRINALTPADEAVGSVEVKVVSNGGTSDAAFLNLQALAPAIFTYDGSYVATSMAANAMLDQSEKFFAAPLETMTALAPGDTVTLYCTGLGLTDPFWTAGALPVDNLTERDGSDGRRLGNGNRIGDNAGRLSGHLPHRSEDSS